MFRRSCLSPATLFTVILVACFLSACSSNGKQWNPEDYTVKSGDTIFSIAWRYELDADEFAAWNGIRASKFIKPGQRLHTRKPANFDADRKTRYDQSVAYAPSSSSQRSNPDNNQINQKWVKAEKGDTLYGLSKRYGISVNRLAQLNQLKKPYVIKPGQTIFLKPLNTEAQSSSTASTRSSKSGSHTAAKQTKYAQSQIGRASCRERV